MHIAEIVKMAAANILHTLDNNELSTFCTAGKKAWTEELLNRMSGENLDAIIKRYCDEHDIKDPWQNENNHGAEIDAITLKTLALFTNKNPRKTSRIHTTKLTP